MSIIFAEQSLVGASLQWTGTNQTEFEEYLSILDRTGSVTVSSNQVTVNWDAGTYWGSGSRTLNVSEWLYEHRNANDLLIYSDENFTRLFRQVYP